MYWVNLDPVAGFEIEVTAPRSEAGATSILAVPSKVALDNHHCVTVWLHEMRNQTVTHSADATFHALADPTRRAVLDLLRDGRQTAGDIALAFPVSRPAISKHLRLLLRANLVGAHSSGRHRFYELNPEPLTAVDTWLARYRQFWTAKLTDLKGFVESGGAAPRQVRRKSRHSRGETSRRQQRRQSKH